MSRRIFMVEGEEVTQQINALSFAIQKDMAIRKFSNSDTLHATDERDMGAYGACAEVVLRSLH